jgi:hypothetical protein
MERKKLKYIDQTVLPEQEVYKILLKDILLDQDLSGYLTSLENRNPKAYDEPKEIQFECTLPQNILEPYNGQYAWISYGVIAEAERKWLPSINVPSINVKVPFRVKKENKIDNQSNRTINEERNSNGIYLRIDLEKSVLTPGETVEGQLTIENSKRHRIRGIKMSLIGSERATAEYKVHLSKRVDHIERITPVEKYHMDVAWKDGPNVPFRIDLFKEMKKSYCGKFSEYFWILDTELDVLFARNFHLKTDIQIV